MESGTEKTEVYFSVGGDPVLNTSYLSNYSGGTAYNVSHNEDADKSDGPDLGQALWIFVGPVILLLGLCGNCLILVIMGRRKFRGTSTSVYLRLMCVSDMFVLLTGIIPEWLEACDILVFKYIHPATCKLEKFLHYTSGDTSIWILVTFTIDRMIAINFPLSKKGMCLPSRAKYNVLIVLMCTISKNFHVFWTRGAEFKTVTMEGNMTELVLVSNCGRPTPGYKYFEKFIRPWIAFTIVSAIPFIIILVCNTLIIRALISVRRMHKSQKVESSSDKTLIQMSFMCLSASFAFLICITPSVLLLVGKPYWVDPNKPHKAYNIAKAINNQLVYVNHSINFFLYCLTGKRFRHELIRICRRNDNAIFSDGVSEAVPRTTAYKGGTPSSSKSSSSSKRSTVNNKNGVNFKPNVRYTKVEVCSAESTV